MYTHRSGPVRYEGSCSTHLLDRVEDTDATVASDLCFVLGDVGVLLGAPFLFGGFLVGLGVLGVLVWSALGVLVTAALGVLGVLVWAA